MKFNFKSLSNAANRTETKPYTSTLYAQPHVGKESSVKGGGERERMVVKTLLFLIHFELP